MQRHNILHVYKDFAPYRGGGGVARHIDGLASVTAGDDFAIRVAAPSADPGEPNAAYAVVKTRLLGLWRHIGWADTVHVHGARSPMTAVAAALARIRGKHVVYTPHCYYDGDSKPGKRVVKYLWDHLVERRLLRGCDAVVLLSDFWIRYLEKRALPVSHPVLLPNCVLGSRIRRRSGPATKLAGSPAILSVGRLDVVKRLEDAILALAEPGLDQAVLHLVGLGPDRPRLAAIAHAAGLSERVHFHGFLDDAVVAGMAAAADVFVLPSAAEGMPTVLIEMILLGCPVVASNIPGNRAIFDQVGLDNVYPVGDVSRLAKQLLATSGRKIPSEVQTRTRACLTWEGMRAHISSLYAPKTQNPMAPGQHIRIFSCPLDLLSRQELLTRVRTALSNGERLRIEGLNVAKLVEAQSDARLRQALDEAEIVHIDGNGIVLGLSLLNIATPPRSAGIDLMQDLCAEAASLNIGIYLLGGQPEIAAATATRLMAQYPKLRIAGFRGGYFGVEDEVQIVEAISASGAGFLFVGISSPKKELFLQRHWANLGVSLAMGVGGSFDVLSGSLPRAPRLLQRGGMEWLFRLLLEPRRLAGRYLRTNFLYLLLVLRARLGLFGCR